MSAVRAWRPALLATAMLCSMAIAPPAHAADEDIAIAAFLQRLQRLDADPATSGVAPYERLQARQAVDALAAARSRDRAIAQTVAERRVEAAEVAARTAGLQREIDLLDRERSELLVEASRQDAARARQEAERLRVQAQIQAEEATRLREQADAESAARLDAETALDGVAGSEAEKLKVARQREAELARREAELMGGDAVPPATPKPAVKPKTKPKAKPKAK